MHSFTRDCCSWNCPSSAESIHASWNISWGESGLMEGYPLRPLLQSNIRVRQRMLARGTCHSCPSVPTPDCHPVKGSLAQSRKRGTTVCSLVLKVFIILPVNSLSVTNDITRPSRPDVRPILACKTVFAQFPQLGRKNASLIFKPLLSV